MSEPITIPLSEFQRARIAVLEQEKAVAQDRLNQTVTAIIAGTVDNTRLAGWSTSITDAGIVLTPPTAPQLVRESA